MADSSRPRRKPLAVVSDGEGHRRIIDEGTGEIQNREPRGARSIEDLAEEGGTQEFLVMPIIEGSQGRLDGRAGGREVTTAELKFKGGPLVMSGQFPEGARVRVLMEFEVTDVNFSLVRHQGHVVGKKRTHQGELVGYGQVPAKGNLMQQVDALVAEEPDGSSGK